MSFRMRIALYCAALCILILLLAGLITYALHVRGHYDDLDRILVANSQHATVEIENPSGPLRGTGGLEVILRLYNTDGKLLDSTPGTETIPQIEPVAVTANPGKPAFDFLAGLVPPVVDLPPEASQGSFGLITTPEQRWRVFVLPYRPQGELAGYIETLSPLGGLDDSMQRFRIILIILGLAGVGGALGGGRILAGQALKPISKMVQTAHSIAGSKNFSQRINLPPSRDELGRLATTFNEMLVSLEEAYNTQQRFISDASHELRAPLTAIQGNLELLRLQKAMSEREREEALAEAEREAGRLTRLVTDLLVLARADAGVVIKRQPVDLDTVVLESLRSARQLTRGQKLLLDTFEPVKIKGDEDRLKQLVLILLDNALKYTPDTGSVTISLRCHEKEAEIFVTDTGVGIRSEDLPHVFERFYRADPARGRDPGGTGLGLAIAHWIIEQHDGRIELTSQPNKGTTVKVFLPL